MSLTAENTGYYRRPLLWFKRATSVSFYRLASHLICVLQKLIERRSQQHTGCKMQLGIHCFFTDGEKKKKSLETVESHMSAEKR